MSVPSPCDRRPAGSSLRSGDDVDTVETERDASPVTSMARGAFMIAIRVGNTSRRMRSDSAPPDRVRRWTRRPSRAKGPRATARSSSERSSREPPCPFPRGRCVHWPHDSSAKSASHECSVARAVVLREHDHGAEPMKQPYGCNVSKSSGMSASDPAESHLMRRRQIP